MHKERIVLFGASLGGKRAFKGLRKTNDIICFVDNDATKLNSDFMGKSVLSPAQLVEMNFDKYLSRVFMVLRLCINCAMTNAYQRRRLRCCH